MRIRSGVMSLEKTSGSVQHHTHTVGQSTQPYEGWCLLVFGEEVLAA